MDAKVMIVDDDEMILEAVELFFKSEGIRILTAASGQKCLDLLVEGFRGVILMDVMMPQMDGFEATRLLKENAETRIIPIAMVTTLNEVKDRVKALEAGADDFLSKPVDVSELKATVQSLLKVKAFHDYPQTLEQIKEWITAGDIVLVKGSRGMKMERIVEGLRESI